MKYFLMVLMVFTLNSAILANAKVISQSQELILMQSKDLPEAAQSTGKS